MTSAPHGSSLVTALAVLAALGMGVVGTYLALGSSDSKGTVVDIPSAEWTAMKSELDQLRLEVDELRANQSKTAFESRAPTRDLQADPFGGKAVDVDAADKEEDDVKNAKGGDVRWTDGWKKLQNLNHIKDPAERHALALELLEADEFWVRNGAVHELMKHDPAAAVAAAHQLLADAAHEEKGGYAAVGVVDALGHIEGYPVANDLRRIYDENEMKGVPLAAARALDRQGDSSLIQLEVNRFAEMVRGDDERSRMWGIGLLGETRSSVAVPYLLPLLNDSDAQTRIQAVRALGRTGGSSEIAALEAMLNDPVAAVRDQAVETLASIRNGENRRGK